MSDHPFDDLARTLASGASRRGVLRAIGGAVLGSLVAAPAQTVLAQGNSTCAHFCAAVFGANTPAAGQCTSDAAHGNGLCVKCGARTSPSSICCSRNGRGLCSSYSSATCCQAPANATATCTNGTCGFTCKQDYTLCQGACVPTCTGGTTLNMSTCTCTATCTPPGGPCDLNNPGACCNRGCLCASLPCPPNQAVCL
jgi:hypothetical protein